MGSRARFVLLSTSHPLQFGAAACPRHRVDAFRTYIGELCRIKDHIERVHQESRGTYGSPRVYRELKACGVVVGENRVARLMRLHGIKARVAARRYYRGPMKRFHASVPNLTRDIELRRADQVRVGDITYLKVGGDYRYLAVVMDKYSRRILGWAFGKTRGVWLAVRALDPAVRARQPLSGLIFHSDHGMEYSSTLFGACLARRGTMQSMNRPGKTNDNVHIESFFHSLKTDIVHGVQFAHDHEMTAELSDYMPFYNKRRLHSSLGYVPPATYKQQPA
jgi:transposase InsO family protein